MAFKEQTIGGDQKQNNWARKQIQDQLGSGLEEGKEEVGGELVSPRCSSSSWATLIFRLLIFGSLLSRTGWPTKLS